MTRTGRARNTSIFTIPAQVCSGTIVSIQYCYRARNGTHNTNVTIFNFLVLTRNGSSFTVVRSFSVRTTPRVDICTSSIAHYYCCDKFNIDPNDQILLSSSDLTFGVVNRDGAVRPLAFKSSATEFRVVQFSARPARSDLNVGRNFDGDQQSMSSLLLLRFEIGKQIVSPILS